MSVYKRSFYVARATAVVRWSLIRARRTTATVFKDAVIEEWRLHEEIGYVNALKQGYSTPRAVSLQLRVFLFVESEVLVWA